MSRTDFYIIGDQKIPWEDAQRTQVSEFRCDGCGEFLSEDQAVTIQSAQIFMRGMPIVYVPAQHFHLEHTPKSFVPFLTAGR